MRINVACSSMPPFEEYCAEIRDLWDTHWLTNNGEKALKLEAALMKVLDTPNVVLFSNGHLALEAAIRAMGLSGEVITTPYTFASTTHALVRCGVTPVFADIRPDTYTIDPAEIERKITPRTTAIVPVHVYGNFCDVEAIAALAEKHHLKVLYDAAHAFGATHRGQTAAAFGDAAMFSFHATKVFHTIEGGAVVCKSAELANALRLERNFGITGPENTVSVGGNATAVSVGASTDRDHVGAILELVATILRAPSPASAIPAPCFLGPRCWRGCRCNASVSERRGQGPGSAHL